MNNKPIGWIDPNDRLSEPFSWNKTSCHTIPLYTHPANTISTPQPQTFTGENPFPAKTLTDEEINEVWWQTDVTSDYYKDSKEFGLDFARAILRKAQEK